MIYDEICTYEAAKLAKERGFDVPTHYAYNENRQKAMYMELCLNRNTKDSSSISAPTQSLLQRWLREEKKIEVYVRNFEETTYLPYHYWNLITDGNGKTLRTGDKIFATYELALEDALKWALENLV